MMADRAALIAAGALRSADQACARCQIRLPAARQAAGLARHAVREALACWGLSHLAEPAILLVSELVGNAIKHARGNAPALELRLAAAGHLLRIEVLDADPRAPRPRTPAALDESGFGLVLVQALADDWGVRQTATGKAVWIELHTGQPAARPHEPTADGGGRTSLETLMDSDTPAPPGAGAQGTGARATGAQGNGPHTERPDVARMFDCYPGGKDHFAADREAAQWVLAVAPDVPPGVVYLSRWYRHVTDSPVPGDGGTGRAYVGIGSK